MLSKKARIEGKNRKNSYGVFDLLELENYAYFDESNLKSESYTEKAHTNHWGWITAWHIPRRTEE